VGIDGQGLTVQAGAMPLKAHLLLDGVVDAEAKDLHLLLLPDAVRPVHGLQAAAASGLIRIRHVRSVQAGLNTTVKQQGQEQDL